MGLSAFLTVLEDLRRRGEPNAGAALLALEDLIARGQAIADALDAVEVGAATHVAVPFTQLLETVRRAESFIATYFADLDFPPDLFLALRAAAAACMSLETLRHRFAPVAGESAGSRGELPRSGAARVPYRLRQGDTLERLARDLLGDVTRAGELVELNDLVYPFLRTERNYAPPQFDAPDFSPLDFVTYPTPDRTGVPAGVLVTGEVLWLPSDAQLPDARAGFTDLDVELYGRDLVLRDGVPIFDGNGQAATVEGKANIVQALQHRIATRQGELVLHPDYGMDQLLAVGIEGTRTNALLGGMTVARTVMQDPRVVQVRDLQILFQDTVNAAAMTVGLIGGAQRALPLNLVIPDTAVGPA